MEKLCQAHVAVCLALSPLHVRVCVCWKICSQFEIMLCRKKRGHANAEPAYGNRMCRRRRGNGKRGKETALRGHAGWHAADFATSKQHLANIE